jgi:hypothetical protein
VISAGTVFTSCYPVNLFPAKVSVGAIGKKTVNQSDASAGPARQLTGRRLSHAWARTPWRKERRGGRMTSQTSIARL